MRRVLPVLLLLSAIPVDAQYTWVRYVQLPPDQQVVREPFDKLLAGKRIAAWGVLAPLSCAGESWTHAIYVTAPNWSAFEAVTSAFDAAGLSGPLPRRPRTRPGRLHRRGQGPPGGQFEEP